jgi:hypothetical protein
MLGKSIGVERFEVLGTCLMGGVSALITSEISTAIASWREYTQALMTGQEKSDKDITQLLENRCHY